MSGKALIVGGFASISSYYLPLKWALQQNGYRCSIISPGPFSLNIWPIDIFLSKSKKVLQETNESVFLIGHSLGGIQAIVLADQYPEQIRRVFTVGSPVWGCPISLYQKAILALIHVSDTEHERFKKEIVPRVTPKIVTISCENDVLAPSSVCEIPGAKNYRVIVDDAGLSSSHLLLPYISSSLDIITKEMESL